jgi:hypothetical protein
MKQLRFSVWMVFSLVLLSICVSAQANGVVVYNDYNFQGANTTLTESWKGGGGFDRIIKSIRVPAGYRVRMFAEKNFKGTETMITEDWNPDRI